MRKCYQCCSNSRAQNSSKLSLRYQRYQRYQAMPWPYCLSGGRPRKPHRSRRKLSDDPCIESTESKTRQPENTQKQILPWLRIGYTLAAHKLHIAALQQAGQRNISTLWTLDIDRLLLPSRGHWEPLTAGQSQPRTKHSQENALTYSDMLSISIYDLDLRSFCILLYPFVLSCWYFSQVVPTVLLVRCPKFIESAWSKGGQWMALASGSFESFWILMILVHWIGLLGKSTGNPWVFTIKLIGLSCKFSHHPILWLVVHGSSIMFNLRAKRPRYPRFKRSFLLQWEPPSPPPNSQVTFQRCFWTTKDPSHNMNITGPSNSISRSLPQQETSRSQVKAG